MKAICKLLKNGNAEVETAAALVLAQIHPCEASVSKALGEALLSCSNPKVSEMLLYALQENPHEQSIRYLLTELERENEPNDLIFDAIASVGGKAVSGLKNSFHKGTRNIQCSVAEIMTMIRTEQAIAFLVEILFFDDVVVVKAAIHAIREQMQLFNKKQGNDLLTRLKNALGDKRLKDNATARSAIIISLGILADPRAKKMLLPYIDHHSDEMTRRHALDSLSRLEYTGDGHGDILKALHRILEEDNLEVVKLAIDVLQRIKPRRKDADPIRAMLSSRHSIVQAYAIGALGSLNTITHARLILPFLTSQDRNLCNAAHAALSDMSSATEVLWHAFYQNDGNKLYVHEVVRILREHRERISSAQIKELQGHLFEYMQADDPRLTLYREAMLVLDGQALRQAVVSRVSAAKKKKDYIRIRDCLRLLKGTEFMNSDLRFTLAIAKLKTSPKEISRTKRMGDYCLELIGMMLDEGGKKFSRKFMSESALDVEDFYYVGFHFSEKLNEERRFGEDLLRHVKKKWPRHAVAKAAKEKLKIEGH
ncbi:MAG: HEAT repeat domain-containing protein [Planctomycetota bacterium]